MVISTLRELSEKLRTLVNVNAAKADQAKEQYDFEEQAFYNGRASGYAMAARLLAVHATEIENGEREAWEACRFDACAVDTH